MKLFKSVQALILLPIFMFLCSCEEDQLIPELIDENSILKVDNETGLLEFTSFDQLNDAVLGRLQEQGDIVVPSSFKSARQEIHDSETRDNYSYLFVKKGESDNLVMNYNFSHYLDYLNQHLMLKVGEFYARYMNDYVYYSSDPKHVTYLRAIEFNENLDVSDLQISKSIVREFERQSSGSDLSRSVELENCDKVINSQAKYTLRINGNAYSMGSMSVHTLKATSNYQYRLRYPNGSLGPWTSSNFSLQINLPNYGTLFVHPSTWPYDAIPMGTFNSTGGLTASPKTVTFFNKTYSGLGPTRADGPLNFTINNNSALAGSCSYDGIYQ